jgi:hypothetical protein
LVAPDKVSCSFRRADSPPKRVHCIQSARCFAVIVEKSPSRQLRSRGVKVRRLPRSSKRSLSGAPAKFLETIKKRQSP